MAPKRTRTEYEKERRRADAAVENEKNARTRAFKRIDRSLFSEFEKERSKIVPPDQLPAIVAKNGLVLAQRAGFLDPLKHLRVSDLKFLVHVLINCDHPFVKTITDALEKYEGSLPSVANSSSVSNAQSNFREDTWEEKKLKRAEDLCCLLLANEYDYAALLWNQEEEWKKDCIAKRQDLWRSHYAMRFIREEPRNPSTVVCESSPSIMVVPNASLFSG